MRISDWSSDVCSSDLAHIQTLSRVRSVEPYSTTIQSASLRQLRSTQSAMPVPPPLHSVARTSFPSRLSLSCISVTRTRAHDAPRGGPRARRGDRSVGNENVTRGRARGGRHTQKQKQHRPPNRANDN